MEQHPALLNGLRRNRPLLWRSLGTKFHLELSLHLKRGQHTAKKKYSRTQSASFLSDGWVMDARAPNRKFKLTRECPQPQLWWPQIWHHLGLVHECALDRIWRWWQSEWCLLLLQGTSISQLHQRRMRSLCFHWTVSYVNKSCTASSDPC